MVGPVTPSTPTAPFRRSFDAATTPYAARNALGITGTGGGGGGAPVDAQYITAASDPTLTSERVLTNTATVTWDFTTPGQAKANGAPGPTGPAGPTGPTGPTGATGPAGAGITDGDKTDITVSGIGATWTIDNDVVTYAKMQNVSAASKLLGRGSAAGAGDPQEITLGTNLAMSGTTLNATSTTTTTNLGGRLEYVSATALSFKPYDGNQIKIAGTLFTISTGGITGLANTGIFINSAGGSSLAANVTYLICAFNNAGVVTADFRTVVSHVTDTTAGNEGVEVHSADVTRTVIGMCRTNASSQFVDTTTQRFVRSWFNDRQTILGSSALSGETTTSTTFIELASSKRLEFINWVGENVDIIFHGNVSNSATGTITGSCIGIDSTTVPASSESNMSTTTATYRQSFSSRYTQTVLSEGYHFAAMLGAVSSGTGTWNSPFFTSGIGGRLIGFLGGTK